MAKLQVIGTAVNNFRIYGYRVCVTDESGKTVETCVSTADTVELINKCETVEPELKLIYVDDKPVIYSEDGAIAKMPIYYVVDSNYSVVDKVMQKDKIAGFTIADKDGNIKKISNRKFFEAVMCGKVQGYTIDNKVKNKI